MLSGGGGGGGQDRLLRPPTNTITTPIPARPGSPPQSQTQTHTHTHTHTSILEHAFTGTFDLCMLVTVRRLSKLAHSKLLYREDILSPCTYSGEFGEERHFWII